MDIALALGSFLVILGACALAARSRPALRPVTTERIDPGEPGFLRHLAS